MTLALEPIALGTDPARFAAELAPAFGGDEGPAREILDQTVTLLTRDPRPAPWGSYLARLDGQAIGICAFKSAPNGGRRGRDRLHDLPGLRRARPCDAR